MNEILITHPCALIILDGFGSSKKLAGNAIGQAHTPHLDAWLKQYPHALLQASGEAVGLPPNTIGNSEVGHLTIGAGRIIEQPVVTINKALQDGSFYNNPLLQEPLKALAAHDKALHIFGLVSDASVHSHLDHIVAYAHAAQQCGVQKIYIHAFLDGRDVPPQSCKNYLNALEEQLEKIGIGSIASITGRFYAMDRDHNWERTQATYDMLTTPNHHTKDQSWQEAIDYYYADTITDEFIPPTLLCPKGIIKNGDGIIFANFRPDRARQLTAACIQPNFNEFQRKKIDIACFITPTNYRSKEFETITLFDTKPIDNTLKDQLSKRNLSLFTIAETEKYAHVTYFFAGGKETNYPNETQILVPSIPKKQYIDLPEMSAREITHEVVASLQKTPRDFYLINYANADMVGHSGNLAATIKAAECIDKELYKLHEEIVIKRNGTMIITADHGNAEEMIDTNGNPKTAHTTNPVPCILINQAVKDQQTALPLKTLADISPFILQNLDYKKE